MNQIDWSRFGGLFTFHEKKPLLFNSLLFLLLFLAFMIIFFSLRKKHTLRIIFCTIFSFYFYYKSSGIYVLILMGSTLIDYNAGNFIFKAKTLARKRFFLFASIFFNLGVLGYFKYSLFFGNLGNFFLNQPLDMSELIIPAGISFFTFQAMSYTIDIYRGHIKPVPTVFDFAFFVSFFPHFVAGPIIRASDLIPQIRKPSFVSSDDLSKGLMLICGGLFKKVLIADFIGQYFADEIIKDPTRFTGIECLFAVYGYALIIYGDFSGYSDMAIGIARMLGFWLPPNFNAPYTATSVTDFWRRWHISLSTWLRDYLYIPLGGNRSVSKATYIILFSVFAICLASCIVVFVNMGIWWPFLVLGGITLIVMILASRNPNEKKEGLSSLNLMTTMFLGGLWHGPSLNFVVWGVAHGFALAFEKVLFSIWPPNQSPVRKFFGWLLTFHFVCFCWIFFAAPSFENAWAMVTQIFTFWHGGVILELITSFYPVFILMVVGYFLHFTPQKWELAIQHRFAKAPVIVKSLLVSIFILFCIQFMSDTVRPFIYFNF